MKGLYVLYVFILFLIMCSCVLVIVWFTLFIACMLYLYMVCDVFIGLCCFFTCWSCLVVMMCVVRLLSSLSNIGTHDFYWFIFLCYSILYCFTMLSFHCYIVICFQRLVFIIFDILSWLAFYSLNSLAVRVPHNISRRVLEFHSPNPLLEIGFTTLCFKKPLVL